MLSASREAISAEESFLCIASADTPGTFNIQTQRDQFLTIGDESKAPEVRGDAEAISFDTNFRIRMQARFKPRLKANKELKAREKISRRELEDVVGRRLDDGEVKRLKKARREGDYHETILDVRVKGKHDKVCTYFGYMASSAYTTLIVCLLSFDDSKKTYDGNSGSMSCAAHEVNLESEMWMLLHKYAFTKDQQPIVKLERFLRMAHANALNPAVSQRED